MNLKSQTHTALTYLTTKRISWSLHVALSGGEGGDGGGLFEGFLMRLYPTVEGWERAGSKYSYGSQSPIENNRINHSTAHDGNLHFALC